MQTITRIVPVLVTFLLGAACGDDPVSYSEPVSINLKAKSGDVANNVVSDEKGITTESSNPYGSFIADAETALDGHSPSRIGLDSVSLLLGAQSTGVVSLEEIFGADVDVLFQMNDSDNTHIAAMSSSPTGAGPFMMETSFDSGSMNAADFDKLLQGSFKVVIRGAAAPTFETKGAEADLQLTFEFTAFE